MTGVWSFPVFSMSFRSLSLLVSGFVCYKTSADMWIMRICCLTCNRSVETPHRPYRNGCVRVEVRIREALVILDEASYCGPVRTVQLVRCFYEPPLIMWLSSNNYISWYRLSLSEVFLISVLSVLVGNTTVSTFPCYCIELLSFIFRKCYFGYFCPYGWTFSVG